MSQRPDRIGKYKILSELGRGATAVVYLGEDSFNERKVAIKVQIADESASEEEDRVGVNRSSDLDRQAVRVHRGESRPKCDRFRLEPTEADATGAALRGRPGERRDARDGCRAPRHRPSAPGAQG